MRRRLVRDVRLGQVFGGACITMLAISGCTLILGKLGTSQCDSDDQCEALAPAHPELHGAKCSSDHVCVVPVVDSGLPDVDAAEADTNIPILPDCTKNQECIDVFTRDAGADAPIPAICIKGAPRVGHDDAKGCVKLENEDCVVAPYAKETADYVDDNAAFFAGFEDLSAAEGNDYLDAEELTFRQIKRYAQGIPNPKNPSGPKRPVVLLRCDSSLDPYRGIKHIIALRDVPGVLAEGKSDRILDIASNYTIPNEIFLIGTGNARAPALSTLGVLFWPTQVNAKWGVPAEVKMLNDSVNGLEPVVNPGGGRIKVAIAQDNLTVSDSIANSLQNSLQWDLAQTPPTTPSYMTGQYYFRGAINPQVTAAQLGASIAQFGPQVVIVESRGATDTIIKAVENNWQADGGPRPYYIGGLESMSDNMSSYLSTQPTVASRIRVIAYSSTGGTATSDGASYADFASAYKQEYGATRTPPLYGSLYYDAAYALVYAYFAAGAAGGNVNGPEIASGSGIVKLIPKGGVAYNVGIGSDQQNIKNVLTSLSVQGTIDLQGASNLLDWDDTTREVRPTSTKWWVECYHLTGGPPPAGWKYSGVDWNPSNGTLTGTYSCP